MPPLTEDQVAGMPPLQQDQAAAHRSKPEPRLSQILFAADKADMERAAAEKANVKSDAAEKADLQRDAQDNWRT